MASVSSLGSGSGLDLSGLLTSLMQAEQAPLTALQKKEASYQAKISAYGSLQSVLSALQSSASALIPATTTTAESMYQTGSASVADATIATATASSSAVAGQYSLEVTTLAKAQRLVSPAGSAAVTASLAAGGTLSIELGTLSGTVGSYTYTANSSKTLSISVAAGSTLEQVRDAINSAATDGRVTATIINGTAGKQLVLTSGQTGLTNVMRVKGNTSLGTGFDFDPTGVTTSNLSQATVDGGQAASDAAFKINGIAGTSSTNTVSNMLDGVTLTLLKTTVADTPTTITVSKNKTAALTSALNAFIKSYNTAKTTMSSLGAYNAETKTASTLTGNSTLRMAQSQVRSLVFNTTLGGTSTYQRLSDIGVSVALDGTMSLDSAKLATAVEADYSSVANLVAKVGTGFKKGLDGLIGTSGTVTSATDSTNRLIKDVQKREEQVATRLTAIEKRYRAQFTALDSLIAGMKQTSTYLTQQLANLPSVSSSSSS